MSSDLVKRLKLWRGDKIALEAAVRIEELEATLRRAKLMCQVGMPEYQGEDVVEIIDEALAQTKAPDSAT